MPKVLAFTLSSPGHLFPFIPLLLELRARGHETALHVAGQPTGRTEIAGIATREVAWDPKRAVSGLDGANDRREMDALTRFAAYGEPFAAALQAGIDTESPDMILVDPIMWGGMVTAEASGLPWASISHNPMTLRPLGPDLRGPGLPPPRSVLGRLRALFIAALMNRLHERYLAPVNAARSARGLPSLATMSRLYHAAPLTVATTSEPFEYPRGDWPASVRFVGPMLWEPEQHLPAWIAELDDRPLVLVAGSSIPETGKAKRWVALALESLASEPIQVVATMPADAVPDHVPANARVETFVPHSALLPRAACVVCHGGPGITLKALAAGVPVVAVPFAYDRFEVSRRVEVSGAGVMLQGRRLTPERLRAAVRRAIGSRAGAERIADAFARAGGAPAAVDAILALAERREAALCAPG